ncbi:MULTISPECIES: DUF565 domain-containing protein [Spirulina sp. CCY15215]|uniref:DUF565 domain-containing protein n=1 Tax=Spirulina sp. CCY15215 TaxID=2767591 RepID=UPI00194DBE0C|nr:DUF565 domain-containing protein [Spirulina major]
MQNTRLNSITNALGDRILQLIGNPWRRISIILLALFVGFFASSAITSTTGQLSILDVSAAAICTLTIELINRFVYTRERMARSRTTTRLTFFWDALNAFKIGIAFGFILEAFKLNS